MPGGGPVQRSHWHLGCEYLPRVCRQLVAKVKLAGAINTVENTNVKRKLLDKG